MFCIVILPFFLTVYVFGWPEERRIMNWEVEISNVDCLRQANIARGE